MKAPDVLDYDDYRAYLRDAFAHLKSRDPRFSHGVFARRAGLSSRSHLKSVLDYGLNLSAAAVPKYCAALRLDPERAECLRLLVLGDPEALRRWRFRRSARVMSRPVLRGLQSWSRGLVLSLSRVRGFRADARWVSGRLMGRISPAEAREALDWLKAEGFLVREGRRWARSGRGFVWGEEADSAWKVWLRAAREMAPPRTTHAAFAVLSRSEVRALDRSYAAWLRANLPVRSRSRVPGELHVLLGALAPLSRRGP